MFGFIASVLPDIGLSDAAAGIGDFLGITGTADAAAAPAVDMATNLGVDASTGSFDAAVNNGIVDQAALDGGTAQGTLSSVDNGAFTPTSGSAIPGNASPAPVNVSPAPGNSGIPSLPSNVSSGLKNVVNGLFSSGNGIGSILGNNGQTSNQNNGSGNATGSTPSNNSQTSNQNTGLSLADIAGIGGLGALLASHLPSTMTPTGTGIQSINPSNFKWNPQSVQAPVNGVAYGQQILNPTFKHGGSVNRSVHHEVLDHLHKSGHTVNQETMDIVNHLANRGEPAHHIIGFMQHRKKMAEGGTTSQSSDSYPTSAQAEAAFNAAYPSRQYNQTQQYPQMVSELLRLLGMHPSSTNPNAVGSAPDMTGMPSAQQQHSAVYGYAAGGPLGDYSDGGHFLKGPGDGMSDDIPARIGDHQEARLANEEFVIPADVVSHLGNGSSESGAQVLYKMMDKVRKARTGNPNQGKQINAEKFMPT